MFTFTPLIIAFFAVSFHLFSFFSLPFPNNELISLLSFSSISSSENQQKLKGANKIALGQKIDINEATVDDLTALPMVGRKLAEKIIEEREKHGKFKNVEGLMRIKGIKEKKLEKLRPFITSL